jgi:arylsulfatase A-like enzyme
MRSVSDGRWKLIRYPLVDRTQLFDLTADPHELQNLAGRPEQAAKEKELTELLTAEMRRYGDTYPLTVNAPAKAEWTPPTQQQLDAEDAAAQARRKKAKAPAKK